MFSKILSFLDTKLDSAVRKAVDVQYNNSHLYEAATTAFFLDRDFDKAFKLMAKAADAGDMRGQYELGKMYAAGTGCTKDFEKALHWISAAADQNHIDAIIFIGDMCNDHDKKQAILWYDIAARQGNAMAQTKIGWLYFEQHDLMNAYKWLSLAAKTDLKIAKQALLSVKEKMSQSQIEEGDKQIVKILALSAATKK